MIAYKIAGKHRFLTTALLREAGIEERKARGLLQEIGTALGWKHWRMLKHRGKVWAGSWEEAERAKQLKAQDSMSKPKEKEPSPAELDVVKSPCKEQGSAPRGAGVFSSASFLDEAQIKGTGDKGAYRRPSDIGTIIRRNTKRFLSIFCTSSG